MLKKNRGVKRTLTIKYGGSDMKQERKKETKKKPTKRVRIGKGSCGCCN